MTHQGLAYRFVRSRLALSGVALVMATGCLLPDMKPKKAGGNAGQAGVAGWLNGTTMGNGQESAIGGTRGSSNDTRDHGGATSTDGTTANIGGANQGGAATSGGAATVAIAGSPASGGAANTGGEGGVAGAAVTGGTRATGGSPATGGAPTGGATLAGGTLPTGGKPGTGGAAPTGGKPGTGGEPPSCVGLAKCGADSCCTPLRMDGGTFQMGRSLTGTDKYDDGYDAELPEHDATVSAFALDKYEVTVGRFRKFVENYTLWRNGGNLKVGDGKNGNVEATSREKTGWGQSWTLADSDLPKNADALRAMLNPNTGCNWTPNAGTDAEETYPMNCVSWYESFAFCVWDGGRLPTEAEWEYAAAGGQANRLYPWAGTTIDNTRANYVDSANTSRKAVGSYPAGVGVFGHMDLAGSMWEWVFDWYAGYNGTPESPVPCRNCANITASSYRVLRGGSWSSLAIYLRAAHRNYYAPGNRLNNVGFRCARPTQ